MTKEDIINLEQQKAGKGIDSTWALVSRTARWHYSSKKGFNYNRLINTAFFWFKAGDYWYFAERQQPCNNYYIRVINEQGLCDLITYCSSKKDAMETINLIKAHPEVNNPEQIKRQYYNGSGSDTLHLS